MKDKLTKCKFFGGGYITKHKGFSLIELLAVIVVLAILTFIVVPVIGNLIRLARIRSAVASAYGYVEATNNEIVMKNTRGEAVANTSYDVEENTLNVKYKGSGPTSGYYNVEKVRVTYGEFCINGFDIKYENGRAEYIKDAGYCPSEPTFEEPEGSYLRELCEGETYNATTLYKIQKVEDLACFAKEINEKTEFVNGKTALVANIDITNKKNYKDANTIIYGDINEDGTVEGLYDELNKGKGFKPIGVTNTANKYYRGTLEGNNFTISNLMINRSSENYVGLFGYSRGTIKNINIDNIVISGNNYIGGLIGYNVGTVTEINIKSKVTGIGAVGGIIGYNEGSITKIHINSEVTGTGNNVGGLVGNLRTGKAETIWIDTKVSGISNIGGVAGYTYYSTINEVIGTVEVSGTSNIGGVIGEASMSSGASRSKATNVLLKKAIITGNSNTGGVVGHNNGGTLSGFIIEIGSSNKHAVVGKSETSITSSIGNSYYLSTFTASTNQNTKISSDYYNDLYKYDEVLETSIDGDVNDTGYFFGYDETGIINLVNKDYVAPQPTPGNECTGDTCGGCTENCISPTNGDTGLGTCPDGIEDTEAPTCTFNYIIPVVNGIRASFNCTDNSGAPEVASMFNSENNNKKTIEEIIASGGTYKTGTINGNTRNITSTWTTAYEGNKPEVNRCYYYQYGAKDSCGNWTTYVTDRCWKGFSSN